MLCVLILYISGGTYSLKTTSNDRFFEKLFMAILFYSQSFCQKSAERKSLNKNFSYFVLMSGLANTLPTITGEHYTEIRMKLSSKCNAITWLRESYRGFRLTFETIIRKSNTITSSAPSNCG